MYILGLSMSPRKSGNTAILVAEALGGAESQGAATELYSLAGKEIKPCDGCYGCVETGNCHIKDDMQAVYQKLVAADGIIYGTPIYYYAMAAQAKALIDRTYSIGRPVRKMANKVGGVISVAGRLGIIDALKDFYFYFAINHMLAADYVIAYAQEKGGVREDEYSTRISLFDIKNKEVSTKWSLNMTQIPYQNVRVLPLNNSLNNWILSGIFQFGNDYNCSHRFISDPYWESQVAHFENYSDSKIEIDYLLRLA